MAGGGLLRTTSIDQSIEDTKDEENGLRRTLGPLDLVVCEDTLGVALPA